MLEGSAIRQVGNRPISAFSLETLNFSHISISRTQPIGQRPWHFEDNVNFLIRLGRWPEWASNNSLITWQKVVRQVLRAPGERPVPCPLQLMRYPVRLPRGGRTGCRGCVGGSNSRHWAAEWIPIGPCSQIQPLALEPLPMTDVLLCNAWMTALVRLPRPKMAGSAGQHRRPDRRIRRLFA